MKQKCCFLDRDGVINVEVNYLQNPDDVIIEPGVPEALKLLKAAGFLRIVVTNQAGVAKGYFPESAVQDVHRRIAELLAGAGTEVDAFYHCPHHPDFTGACDCRKPAPGMLLRAAADHQIDLAASCMVGDRPSDLEAGINAGCRESFLVRSGYGEKTIRGGGGAG